MCYIVLKREFENGSNNIIQKKQNIFSELWKNI